LIVVIGPPDLSDAVTAACPGELVVGCRDDPELGGPLTSAARSASELPLNARATVVSADRTPAQAVVAVRNAGGALEGTVAYVLGEPPPGTFPTAWHQFVERYGGIPAHDAAEFAALLAAAEDPSRNGNANGNRPVSRPGAPESAAWREWLLASPTRQLPRRFRLQRRSRLPKVDEFKLDAHIRRPLGDGCRSIAVISPKGGVGKTLLSFLLGSVLADVRGDRVLVVDTNPDFGTLADLVASRVPATISDLINDLPTVTTKDQLTRYMTATETGMHILAAPQDPVEMGRLGSGGYLAVNHVIRRHYDIVVYDCGTGFLDEITQFALRHADQVALISAPLLVTAKIILGAVDHLEETNFDLLRTTLVLNMVRRDDNIDRARLSNTLNSRLGGIVEVPFDPRVQRDMDLGRFRYSQLATSTRLAVKRLASQLVSRLPALELAATPQ
jgi:MinD-like ATPase involved in chromosome partitioning or flagellar assembly